MEIRFVGMTLTMVCILVLFTFWRTLNTDSSSPLASPTSGKGPLGSAMLPYQSSPFTASWSSWFNPIAWVDSGATAQRAGKIDKDWNILYHLGGNGPWIQKVDDVVTNDIAPPEGCTVQQVHMISRHGERYPTISSGQRMVDLVTRLRASGTEIKGDLSFLNNWNFFLNSTDSAQMFEQLTPTGPYAGTLGAFTTGVKLRTRYSHLLPRLADGTDKVTTYWASDSDRVRETAQYLATGLFGLKANESSALQVISEMADQGADTLTPGDTCLSYSNDEVDGHDLGTTQMTLFRSTYLRVVGKRLEKQLSTKVIFSDEELYAMQELCGFETTATGKSPWCDVFTKDEWLSFEYARDLLHFYRSGPGNKFGTVLGSLWVNATAQLLAEGPNAGPFFFSFSHDGSIVPVLAILDLLHDDDLLPVTHVVHDRKWRTSQVMPMGGRIILERMSCKKASSATQDIFVRININDGIVAFPSCHDGPGHSCSLNRFLEIIARNVELAGNFKSRCGLSQDSPDGITFLHQKSTA